MTVRNAVVIVLDALRADRVGATTGTDTSLTPHIDEVAEDGAVFENAYTCSPNTDSSVTAIETGRYPLRSVLHHGRLVTDNEKRRIENITPVQQLLSDRGWHTAAVGHTLDRWHRRGFDAYPESGSGVATLREQALERAVDGYNVLTDVVPPVSTLVSAIYDRIAYDSQSPTLVGKDFDPTELLSHTDRTPFFGYVHLMDTHIPYIARQEDIDRLLANREYGYGTLTTFLDERDVTDAQADQLRSSLDRRDTDCVDELLAAYDAAVMNADRKVGDLLDALAEAGLADETAIFITSDHGESLLEHDIYFDHHGLYDSVMHVPLVTNLGDGTRYDTLVQEIDIAPTILDVLDVDVSAPMDGRSLYPLLSDDGSFERRDAVFAEEGYTERRYAVRTADWKLIEHVPDDTLAEDRGSSLRCGYCNTVHGSDLELYDLTADPSESDNVANAEPEQVETLRSQYQSFVETLHKPQAAVTDINYESEEELLERLQSLGYK